MSTFVHTKLTSVALLRRNKAAAQVIKDLFADLVPESSEDDTVVTFYDAVNLLLNIFTEEGVRILFRNPTLRAEQLEKAKEFAYVSFNDTDANAFDLQTTLAVLYIQMLFPIQNNRRQARQKEIEKFLTRDLSKVWTDAFKNWITELLIVQEYANSRYITFFRFSA